MTDANLSRSATGGGASASLPGALPDINLLPVSQQVSLLERLLAKTSRDDETGCWNWTGRRCGSGYGALGAGKRLQLMPHRVSYLFFRGPITAPVVRHRCDNRLCLNPDHLELGTHRDNTADMVRRGRHVSGMSLRERCPRGHPYDGVNSRGARICKTCQRAATARWAERRAQ